jgi:hypothetical protein
VGDEQAETYLRLLAEAEIRRAARGSGPGIARSLEQIRWAGDILVTVGLLTPEDVGRVAAELEAALLARPPSSPSRRRRPSRAGGGRSRRPAGGRSSRSGGGSPWPTIAPRPSCT